MLPLFLVFVSALAPQAGLLAEASVGLLYPPTPATVPEAHSAQPPTLPDSVLILVRSDFRIGRFWHGVERMREALGGVDPQDPTELLLLARGEAGWGNWPVIPGLLEEPLKEGTVSGSLPWYFMGRAQEEAGDTEGAERSFTASLEALSAEGAQPERADGVEILLRRARTRLRVQDLRGTLDDLDAVLERDPARGRWLALDLARAAAQGGETEGTLALLSKVSPEAVRLRGWDLPARALLTAGDSAGSEAAYWSAIPSLRSGAQRGLAWERVGSLRLARSDTTGARAAYHRVLQEDPRGRRATGAASTLLSIGFDSASVARIGAEALARGGRERDALQAYGIHEELLGGPVSAEVTLALVRVHLAVREPATALALLDSLEGEGALSVTAPLLVQRIRALGALGRTSEARAVQDSMVTRFPDRPESVEILFLRADARHDRGDIRGAVQGFEATAALSPAQNLAGQARMRLGQIHLSQGRLEEAVEVFQAYLDAFPEGRRWDEAAFWAGRTLFSLGRIEDGSAVLETLRQRSPLSYYSVQAGTILDAPYSPPIPTAQGTPPLPEGLASGLSRIDALLRVGMDEGVDWEFQRLADSIRGIEDIEERRGLLLRLALECNDRGLTREGINLGWEIQRLGGEWDRDLLSAIYPFPYREMVMKGAAERGLDPFLMAALMRQESAFWHEALSRADARGLMQVLPATGRELARARGPRGFDADEHLYRPEINLHLGMSFFSDMKRRFGEDLSIVLSAYNAGPTRALRWRKYPEAGDLPRFVERIPFTETRGYVKNVLRNREIYAWLYGTPEG